MPRLSVIMPVKNGGRYISLSVRSTLAAMPRDSELVIANDGSSDNTQAIIDGISDSRLRSISWTPSRGVSSSLNSLIAETDSDYVARMDADDVCLPMRFAYQEAVIAAHDCVFSNVIFVNSYGFPSRSDLPGHIGPRALPVHLLMGNILVHPTMYARRSFLESLGGYRATPAEDYDLWLRAAEANFSMMRSAVPTLLYRKHDEQVSASGGWLNTDWDPFLDSSFAGLVSKHLNIKIVDNSVRRSCTAGNQGLLTADARAFFYQALARKISELPVADRFLARTRLTKMKRQMLGLTQRDINAE